MASQIILSVYVIVLAIYIVLEAISVAGDSNRYFNKHHTKRTNFIEFLNAELKDMRLALSLRYLISGVAALYLFKEAYDNLFCLVVPAYFNYISAYCIAPPLEWRHAVYITAIALSCWSRMFYRLNGDRRIISDRRVH